MSDRLEEETLVGNMSVAMLTKLDMHSDRPHWLSEDTTDGYLFVRLLEEVVELRENPSWSEAADVANFAAMIADRSVRLDALTEENNDDS